MLNAFVSIKNQIKKNIWNCDWWDRSYRQNYSFFEFPNIFKQIKGIKKNIKLCKPKVENKIKISLYKKNYTKNKIIH